MLSWLLSWSDHDPHPQRCPRTACRSFWSSLTHRWKSRVLFDAKSGPNKTYTSITYINSTIKTLQLDERPFWQCKSMSLPNRWSDCHPALVTDRGTHKSSICGWLSSCKRVSLGNFNESLERANAMQSHTKCTQGAQCLKISRSPAEMA